MAKEKSMAASGLFSEVFNASIYKRNQGRYARQVTFFTVLIVVCLAGWQMTYQPYVNWFTGSNYLIPAIFVMVAGWLAYRLVNLPRFADFLIAVEAEMYKVSWPTRRELVRSSLVVIFVIFSMSALLFGFDVLWRTLFELLGISLGVIVGTGDGGMLGEFVRTGVNR